ncbi:hypothetical protein CPLU01_14944 [Colletotrichum plurivorum]|uniref:Biotrophy-associated secreted protein 2 n=1 Tax=Colletotrichum plurivorum TaxID=2175906 RepID=A0A8H6JGH8_9PEZI|nr:hypothetical protein CPLU01_14944 [Colletotrichum plurivorum]
MKFTLATLLALVMAASAAPADVGAAGLVERQQCGTKGFSCDNGGFGCCAGLTCKPTLAPVGGNGKACQ